MPALNSGHTVRNISIPYPVWLRYSELTLEQIRQAGMRLQSSDSGSMLVVFRYTT